MQSTITAELHNAAFALQMVADDGVIMTSLTDLASGFLIADSPYWYSIRCPFPDGTRETVRLSEVDISTIRDTITIRARAAGFSLEHRITLSSGVPFLEEQITLSNDGSTGLVLSNFCCGFQRTLTNDVGDQLRDFADDRFVAIPFRHKPTDPPTHDNDFDVVHLLKFMGVQPVVNGLGPLPNGHGYVPTPNRYSEGWAWRRGAHTLGIYKFNQSAIEFSVITLNNDTGGVRLRFGGASTMPDESTPTIALAPGAVLHFGVTRIQSVNGGYEKSSYAFRDFLGKNGCNFPSDFNPPVHWNEIYDNAEYILSSPGQPPRPRMTLGLTYTLDLLLREAEKAKAYYCEALYLDPGWDTDFATFLWGKDRLGDARQFVQTVQDQFGLRVALHCPLAPWMSFDGRSVGAWPVEAYRKDQNGDVISVESFKAGRVPTVCLGSHQYLDEAERRLHQLCANGIAFLMFDGNWWQSECWDVSHGHVVPYTKEAHCLANLELAQRVHAKYPDVLIEMHDMLTGGSIMRYTPVYYKYGLPGSHDENWGFELMWQPMEDIRTGKARALYYYNLGCNIPIYLHIDLRSDNIHALAFWWYASTCRHLGIGGTHPNALIAEIHKQSMKRYRELERFFKRGMFFGTSEEAHFHVLPKENAFVVTIFNLSNESRIVSATINAADIGLDLDRWYVVPYSHAEGGFDSKTGTFRISRRLDSWACETAFVHALEA